jgi:hypothetical protein
MLDGEPRHCITVWDAFSDLPKEALESVPGKLMPVGTEFFLHITIGFSGFEKHMDLAMEKYVLSCRLVEYTLIHCYINIF